MGFSVRRLHNPSSIELHRRLQEHMKIIIVVGARPNFMKVAPILRAITAYNSVATQDSCALQPMLVHTGQHYDAVMSDAFFTDLGLPKPDIFLGVGSGSHA